MMCEILYWDTIKDTYQSWSTKCWAETPFCRQYRMICFTSSSIRNLYHFHCVLLQLLGTDIENSLFKYRVSYRHLTFMIETSEMLMKSCENLICYSWIFNVKLHVHLKKWTLKFKLLYLRNYIRYFNNICSICCANTHIQSLKVWLKSVLSYLKYSIFSKALFFIGAPCRYLWEKYLV